MSNVSLDEEGVRKLIVDLCRIGAAAAHGDNMRWDDSKMRNCLIAIGLKVDRMVTDLESSTGMEISGSEMDAIFDDVKPWGERALNLGRNAFDGSGEEEGASGLTETGERLATPTLRRKLSDSLENLRRVLDVPAVRDALEDPEARTALRAYLMEGDR